MNNLYLDVGKEKQAEILNELTAEIGLSSRKLAKKIGFNRSLFFHYRSGRHRMSYNYLKKLCEVAGKNVKDYKINLIEINNKRKCEKIDLPFLNENQMRELLSPEKWQKIVAVGLLTDGCVLPRKSDKRYHVRFFSCDFTLHRCFKTMIKIAFEENQTSFIKGKQNSVWILDYQKSKNSKMMKNLLAFTKSYTCKANCKPSLKFLFDENLETKKIAVRFAMSTDGSVSIKRNKHKKRIDFSLRLACAHPDLVLQWKKIFNDIGLDMRIDLDTAIFSGIHGLTTSKKINFLRLNELGGFFPDNVKVTNGKCIGLMKNQVLDFICKSLKKGKRNIKDIKCFDEKIRYGAVV